MASMICWSAWAAVGFTHGRPRRPGSGAAPRFLSLAAGAWAVASSMKYRICNASEWFFEMEPAPAQAARMAMKARYNAMGWQADTHTPWRSNTGNSPNGVCSPN